MSAYTIAGGVTFVVAAMFLVAAWPMLAKAGRLLAEAKACLLNAEEIEANWTSTFRGAEVER